MAPCPLVPSRLSTVGSPWSAQLIRGTLVNLPPVRTGGNDPQTPRGQTRSERAASAEGDGAPHGRASSRAGPGALARGPGAGGQGRRRHGTATEGFSAGTVTGTLSGRRSTVTLASGPHPSLAAPSGHFSLHKKATVAEV